MHVLGQEMGLGGRVKLKLEASGGICANFTVRLGCCATVGQQVCQGDRHNADKAMDAGGRACWGDTAWQPVPSS